MTESVTDPKQPAARTNRPRQASSSRHARAAAERSRVGRVMRHFDRATLSAASRLARMLLTGDDGHEMPRRFEVEGLELRRLLSVSDLPFRLDFEADAGGLVDKYGLGTGFTGVQQNSNPNFDAYQPSLLHLDTAAGRLRITTTGNSTHGGNSLGDNSLVNALETKFDGASGTFEITARIVADPGKNLGHVFNYKYEQGGIYLGYDQDNFVKLVILHHDSGPRLEFIDEWKDGSGWYSTAGNPRLHIGAFEQMQEIELRILANPTSGLLRAFYRVNGGNWAEHPQQLTVPMEKRLGVFNANSRAGLIQFHKNDQGPITVGYDYFDIRRAEQGPQVSPSVTGMRPASGSVNVRRDTFIGVDLFLPNGAVNPATVNSGTVYLYRTSTGQAVPASVSVSGGGDAITLTPLELLAADTGYTFVISSAVKDVSGVAFEHFTGAFTTGSTVAESLSTVAFDRTILTNTVGIGWTGIAFGPDGKFYGVTHEGDIWRFNVNANGALTAGTKLFSYLDEAGGKRLITGIAFDNLAWQQGELVAYVSHGHWVNPADENDRTAPDWTGSITRFTGANLKTRQDVIVGLPRSVYDHLNNQPVFGPDGRLYWGMASNTAMGAADQTWGWRPERLLSGTILVADVRGISTTIDVKTGDGGTYDPYAPDAPVKIFGYGVRNAYDLLWHSSGHLFAPANGSNAGGNTPASPDSSVPAINWVDQSLNDYLFRIVHGGYYGHPNPLHGNYVLNGGNPTSGPDPAQINQYPVGVTPPPHYQGYAYDFGLNVSPNGIIEYNSNGLHFGGALDGRIVVARYSGGNDLVILDVDPATGKITGAFSGSVGMGGFIDPLDVIQDPATGNLYVVEAGFRSGQGANGLRISLLKPLAAGAKAQVTSPRLLGAAFGDALHFSAIVGDSAGSFSHRVTITNSGTGPLALPADAFTISGSHAPRFTITGAPAGAVTLQPGQSLFFDVTFTAQAKGIVSADLTVKSNDLAEPVRAFKLRGIGATGLGGEHEPSLQRILDLFHLGIRTGDPDPDSVSYPATIHVPGSDEIYAPLLRKAGEGPVTIQILASYGTALNNGKPDTSALGWYLPGSPAAINELLRISKAYAQTVQPGTATLSFDPADDFGLAGTFFDFNDRKVYSQDALNTWEPEHNERRKVRFFPLVLKDGSVVPNAYVFAFEEWEVATDQNDIVGVIYNVTPAAAAAKVDLVNPVDVPFSDRLIFHRIKHLDTQFPNAVHDTAKLRITAGGGQTLTITQLPLSNGDFQIIAGNVTSPLSLEPGQTHEVTIRFIFDRPTSDPANWGSVVRNATLTIFSNDGLNPQRQVNLSGIWQSHSEDGPNWKSQEPNLQEIVEALGYPIDVGPNIGRDSNTSSNTGGKVEPVGAETISPYWRKLDPAKPVEVFQIGAWHRQGPDFAATTLWHVKGSTNRISLMKHHGDWGQSFFPARNNGQPLTRQSFDPGSSAFGLVVDWNWFSDPALTKQFANAKPDDGHAQRWYALRDLDGNIIPGAYLMGHDYTGQSFANYDYNDNVYIVFNVRPDTGPLKVEELAAQPHAAGIFLTWKPNGEGDLAGYHVYRAAGAGGPYNRLNDDLITSLSFNDDSAPIGQTVHYRVVAVNVYGTEGAPAQLSATRPGEDVPPGAPGGLAGSATSFSSVQLSWSHGTGVAAGFRIQRAPAVGDFVDIATVASTITGYTDLGLSPETTYRYRVIAFNAAGESGPGNVATVTTPADLSAPTNLAADAQAHDRVVLTWDDNSQSESNFRIERAVGDGAFTVIGTVPANTTTFTDTSTDAETTYRYRVTAVKGGLAGEPSAPVTVTTPSDQTPAAPANLRSTSADAYRISLAWDVVGDNHTGLRLERAVGDGAFLLLATLPAAAAAYDDMAGVLPETTYRYRIFAFNAGQTSPPSNVLTITTPSDPTNILAPTGLVAVAPIPTQVNLSWQDNADNETAYQVWRRTATGQWTLIAQIAADAQAYVDTTASPDTAYTYRVRAVNPLAQSPWSNDAEVTTPPAGLYTSTNIGDATGTTSVITPQHDFDISATGGPVDGTADNLRYLHRIVFGDFDVRVHLADFDKAHPASAAGLMVRESLGAASSNVFLRSSGEVRLSYRQQTGGDSGGIGTANPGIPVWLRLVRAGDTFTAYYGSDGLNWTMLGLVQIDMPAAVHLGLAVSAFSDSPATAGFRSLGTFEQQPPAPPLGLAASVKGITSVHLSWIDASNNEAGFHVQRRLQGETAWQTLATLAEGSTAWVDADIAAGASYEYRVVAFNAAGGAASDVLPVVIEGSAPPPPANFRKDAAVPDAAIGLALRWDPVAGNLSAFRIERRPAGDDEWQLLTVVRSSIHGLIDASAEPGRTYHYRIIAIGPAGASSPSDVITLSTPPALNIHKPQLTAEALSDSAIRLDWPDTSEGEQRYLVQRRFADGGWHDLPALPADSTMLLDRHLLAGMTYSYRVRAEGRGYVGPWSEVLTVTTPQPAQWQSRDVGAAGGSAQVLAPSHIAPRHWRISAPAGIVGGTSDALHFVYRGVSGDFDFAVRVMSLDGDDPLRSAGLMVRGALDADAANVSVAVNSGQVRMSHRGAPGGQTADAGSGEANLPMLLRLQRTGQTIVAFTSRDGRTWTEIGAVQVDLDEDVYLGLAASGGTGEANAHFRDLTDLRADGPLPTAAVGLVANWDDGLVVLAWTDTTAGRAAFIVEREEGDGLWRTLGFVAEGASGFIDPDIEPGRTYRYRVAAQTPAGTSAYAPPVTVHT